MTQDVYYRTAKGQQATTGDSLLERRHLILLRLVDGHTPVHLFEKHLSHFDIPRLFSELLSSGFIAKVIRENGSGDSDIAKLNSRSTTDSHSRNAIETSAKKPLHIHDIEHNSDINTQQNLVQEDNEVDDVTASFMKRYVKNVSDDDPDIRRFIAERRTTSTNPREQ